MTELFSSIDIQVLISGTWVSLWADILWSAGVKASRGMSGNGIDDRVGDSGTLTFSLDNSAQNSAHLIGYYSPGHANCLSGWTTSLPVRVKFSYDTWTRYKWFGRIAPDGIKVTPGTQAERRVEVTCEDFMALAARHKMNLMKATINKHFGEAIKMVIDNMSIQPQAVWLNDGTLGSDTAPKTRVFPYIFDVSNVDTKAIAEFQNFAVGATSEDGQYVSSGYIVTRGDSLNGETLFATYTGRVPEEESYLPLTTTETGNMVQEDNTDFILMESGDIFLREGGSQTNDGSGLVKDSVLSLVDVDILPESVFSYGNNIINSVTVVTNPRKVGTVNTTVLWTLNNAIAIDPAQTVVVRGAYSDVNGGAKVNGLDFIDPPVASTDYKANAVAAGTATDMTTSLGVAANFGAAEVELSLTNNNAGTLYVGGTVAGCFLQVRGRAVYTYDTIRQITTNTASIQRYGVMPHTVDSRYMDINSVYRPSGLSTIGDAIVSSYGTAIPSPDNLALFANKDTKNMVGFLFVEPCNDLFVTESMNALNSITTKAQGYDFEIRDGMYVWWNLVTKRAL